MEWHVTRMLSNDTSAISTLRCLSLYLERLGCNYLDEGSVAQLVVSTLKPYSYSHGLHAQHLLRLLRSFVKAAVHAANDLASYGWWHDTCLILSERCTAPPAGQCLHARDRVPHRNHIPQLPAISHRSGGDLRRATCQGHHPLLAQHVGQADRLPGHEHPRAECGHQGCPAHVQPPRQAGRVCSCGQFLCAPVPAPDPQVYWICLKISFLAGQSGYAPPLATGSKFFSWGQASKHSRHPMLPSWLRAGT